MSALNDYRIAPTSAVTGHAVVFLHGLGDNGQGGLLQIGRMWQPGLPPDTEFFCPDAPFPFDMDPMGGGRQWFSLRDMSLPAMTAGVKAAAPILDDYIDSILSSRRLTPEKLALVGFSQGTMMSLYVAPRRSAALAGVIGYSGLLAGGDTLAADKKSVTPILLVHGTADEVVPYAYMEPSAAALKRAGFDVQSVTCNGTGHGIDDAGLLEGLKFLRKVLV